MNRIKRPNKHIAILTTCDDPWGGSEELWARGIPYLQRDDFEITVLKKKIHHKHPKIQNLKEQNIHFIELDTTSQNSRFSLMEKGLYRLWNPGQDLATSRFKRFLEKQKPALVVFSQGNNFDGLKFARLCAETGVSYIIISQKAIDYLWPAPEDRDWMINTFKKANWCFFVSPQNQTLTEEQFGFRFTNAQIIHNPLTIEPCVLPYPPTDSGFKLACIGRLCVAEKGQDILLRVFSKKKWRERNLKITFVGDGRDSDGLKALANLFDLKNVDFSGFQDDIRLVWEEHHALILPSRNEGLPLVILEAMAAGRMVITTRAGGSMNLIEDNKTGFLGDATVENLDSTLEKAWQNRSNWGKMGINANEYIVKKVPLSPEIDFAKILSSIANE